MVVKMSQEYSNGKEKKGEQKDSSQKAQEYTRRAFLATGILGGTGLYIAYAVNPLKTLGKAADRIYDTITSFGELGEEAKNLLQKRISLEIELENAAREAGIGEEELKKFKGSYKYQHSVISAARTTATEMDVATKELNEFAKQTPIGRLKDTGYHKLSKKIYDRIQGMLGRNTKSKEYEEGFNKKLEAEKKLIDARRGLEKTIEEAIKEKTIKYDNTEKLTNDYIEIAKATENLRKSVKENGYENLDESLENIDKELRTKVGPEYQGYIEKFRNSKPKLERILPLAGGAITALAAYKASKPISSAAGQLAKGTVKIAKIIKDKTSEKNGEKDDQRTQNL